MNIFEERPRIVVLSANATGALGHGRRLSRRFSILCRIWTSSGESFPVHLALEEEGYVIDVLPF